MKHDLQRSNLGNFLGWKVALMIILSNLIVGGGVYWRQKSRLKTIKEEHLRTQQELQQQVDELRKQLAHRRIPSGVERGTFFKIYGANRDATREEINFYVAIPDDLSLLKKLKLLADKLSRFKFSYLPIDVLRIEDRGGKKIAIIELKETKYSCPSCPSWRTLYFQGSTGGYFTTLTLIETFLQRDYEGEWIDGVEFYYEGSPVSDEWDHISLSGTMYR